MFMFKEGGIRKQIVAFWTMKTYPDIIVNNQLWGPAAELEGNPRAFAYNGMSTFWFWDGERFHETIPRISRFENTLKKQGFEIKSDDVLHHADSDRFFLQFCRNPEDFDLRIKGLDPFPPKIGYKRTTITKKMGFDVFKLYHSKFSGSLCTRGHERDINGSLYMQNITLNSPILPWLWGVFHKDDGSYLTYFTSFLGPLMFSRTAKGKPQLDNMFKFLNKNLNYTTPGGKTKKFRQIQYRVWREKGGLPEFEVQGILGNERLKIGVRTLAKTTYSFERKKIWKNKFFYNEFPSEITDFEYTDENGVVHKDHGDQWTGNSEYSWGLLLN